MSRPRETREESNNHGRRAFALLAAETGLSVDDIADLAARGELQREYQKYVANNGLYRMGSAIGSPIEKRQRLTPQQLVVEIQAKRWPTGPKSARLALLETLRQGWKWETEK